MSFTDSNVACVLVILAMKSALEPLPPFEPEPEPLFEPEPEPEPLFEPEPEPEPEPLIYLE